MNQRRISIASLNQTLIAFDKNQPRVLSARLVNTFGLGEQIKCKLEDGRWLYVTPECLESIEWLLDKTQRG